ncbi:MAG: ABC transporter ATP-binding protein [Conexivisphaerales archaeon]
MIETVELTKTFNSRGWSVEALKGVNFKADRNSITALVGPNGAGKTTLIKIISTLMLPTSGNAYIDGLDVVSHAKEVRKKIGLVTVSDRLMYFRLTGLDNLVFYGALYNMGLSEARSRARELLETVGLGEWGDQPIMHYSTGMLRRLAIARALMHDPDIVLLDEPTLGIDTSSSRRVRQLVRRLATGRTIVLTSHLMNEIEELANNIYLIKSGIVISSGTPAEISSIAGQFAEALVPTDNITSEMEKFVLKYENGRALIRGPKDKISLLTRDYTEVDPTLEDAYILLVGESNADFRPYQIKRGGAWGREHTL